MKIEMERQLIPQLTLAGTDKKQNQAGFEVVFKQLLEDPASPGSASISQLISIQRAAYKHHFQVEMLSKIAESGSAIVRRLSNEQ